MGEEHTVVPRAEFEQHLADCLADPGFRSDMAPPLLTGISYDPVLAAEVINTNLISLLPE
ncbi:hypothetical protein AU476_05400 [Cupriavidus sp. UYMSc13B]|nr:hypothetical protein AU476_05400 [Cupriavidus sp. UYMSc13B]